MKPKISSHYINRKPSSIRTAQISFNERSDKSSIRPINLAIGNVSLPMHPAMIKRMGNLRDKNSPFANGVLRYTSSSGYEETIKAFLNIISYEGIKTSNLNCLITDGGSQAMEIVLLGVCGTSNNTPIMLLDPAYTNYLEFSKRLSIPVVSVSRYIDDRGNFNTLNFEKINSLIKLKKPNGLVVIPYDNPTGQFINQRDLTKLASICVENKIWLISDEAYRQLYYEGNSSSTIWKITQNEVPNIDGFRISIESASKVWNACGLRIGGLVTDNKTFYNKSVNEYTSNLCANALGQYIFGALADISYDEINLWYLKQRNYYLPLMNSIRDSIIEKIPGVLISKPSAAIYLIIDFKNICKPEFDANDFIQYCAKKGCVKYNKIDYTLLFAPLNEFYSGDEKVKTQIRIAIVEKPKYLKLAPIILSELFKEYSKVKS
tara:strand:+ start:1872 stop:3170 length:1299 start_codon:yes stop_codon:yes gene_type:complete